MSEMIERVSRAMWEAAQQRRLDVDAPQSWELLCEDARADWIFIAQAAIVAMRNPPQDVLSAIDHNTDPPERWESAIEAMLRNE